MKQNNVITESLKKKSTSEENPGDYLHHPYAKVRLPNLTELTKIIKLSSYLDSFLICCAMS